MTTHLRTQRPLEPTLRSSLPRIRSRHPFFAQVDLRLEDYQQVANTLVYDGEVEEVTEFDADEDADTTFYKMSPMSVPETNAFTSIPCGVCPVRPPGRSSDQNYRVHSTLGSDGALHHSSRRILEAGMAFSRQISRLAALLRADWCVLYR